MVPDANAGGSYCLAGHNGGGMKKILVVDDNPVIQNFLSHILKENGYESVSAVDGIDAMLLIHKDRPDMVILDIMMPNLNGYEVCRNIKLDPRFKDIPVILLTERNQEIEDAVLGMMGIDYLHKSAKPQDLLEKISAALK